MRYGIWIRDKEWDYRARNLEVELVNRIRITVRLGFRLGIRLRSGWGYEVVGMGCELKIWIWEGTITRGD